VTFTIPGRCVGKKNRRPIYRNRAGKPFSATPPEWTMYADRAVILWRSWLRSLSPVDRAYIEGLHAEDVYMDLLYHPCPGPRMDLSAVFESIGDVLEKVGALKNDRQIVSTCGHVMPASKNPRVELSIQRWVDAVPF
jgi:hypothetical protein